MHTDPLPAIAQDIATIAQEMKTISKALSTLLTEPGESTRSASGGELAYYVILSDGQRLPATELVVGPSWVLVHTPDGRSALVPASFIRAIVGKDGAGLVR